MLGEEKMADKMNNQRIVIYGAGAVGGVVGGLLALAGIPVLLIGRPGNVESILEHGLRVITPGGTHIVRMPAFTTPNQIEFGPIDVVFLCVKGQDTERAISDLHAITEDIPIFCLQNGVRNEEIVSKYYHRVYGVLVVGGGVYTQDGEVTSRGNPPGRFMVGRYPDGTDELCESFAATLRDAGYEVVVTPEIMSYKWSKLLVNLNNAVGAITNVAGEDTSCITRAAQKEGKEILAQAGVRWIPIEESPSRWPKDAKRPIDGPSGISLGSTWQSLTRRIGTVETEFLNGEIVRIARRLGKQAPINETLLWITEEMAASHELPGKYTPAQLIKILKLD
jgi:2-dehydropantoate 2-reductase